MKSPVEVKIAQSDEEPIAIEILAKSIVDLDRVARRIASCGLSKRAIALLLWDAIPGGNSCPTRSQIENVLEYLPKLASIHMPRAK